MLNRANKEELVGALKDKFSRAKVAIFADYKGLTAVQADELRKLVRANGGETKVLKNNLARVAVKENALGEGTTKLMDTVVGPTLVMFGYKDPAAVAKAVHNFAKDNEAFQIKASLMEGQAIAANDVQALADLPSREVLLAQMLGVLNGPARNFVSVLAAVPRGFVTVLQAIADKKKQSS